MPLSKVFEAPTVARLAEYVEQTMSDAPPVIYTPIERVPRFDNWSEARNSITVTNIGQPSKNGLFGTNNDDVLFSFS